MTDQIRRKGEVVSDILDFLIQYKIDCVKRAEPTPIMDRWIYMYVGKMFLKQRKRNFHF